MKRILLWSILPIIIVAIVVAARLADRGLPVRATEVASEPIAEYIDETAVTRLPQTYLITMPLTGRIQPITKTEDDAVEKNEVVARIVPADLEIRVREAQAMVDRLDAAIKQNNDATVEKTVLSQTEKFTESFRETVATTDQQVAMSEARKTFATAYYNRVKELAEIDVHSQDELDRAQLQKVESEISLEQSKLIDSAMKTVQIAMDLMPKLISQYIDRKDLAATVLSAQRSEAEARLDAAKLDQKRGEMHSPVEGVVLERLVSNERLLTAGTPLLRIGRLEDLEVEVEVLTVDAVDIRKGQRVEIYGQAVGKKPVGGTVTSVYPAGFAKTSSLGVEQQRVKVIVVLDDEARALLLKQRNFGVDYSVRVRIITRDKDAAATVPRTSLFRDAAGQWRLFVISVDHITSQPVKVGLMNDRRAEILEGVKPGDQIVLTPDGGLADGARVHVVE